ncbi:monocarboxylate permease-like protein [Trichoderma barbatum]
MTSPARDAKFLSFSTSSTDVDQTLQEQYQEQLGSAKDVEKAPPQHQQQQQQQQPGAWTAADFGPPPDGGFCSVFASFALINSQLGPWIPVLLGSFLHVFGLMMTSISNEYYQILLSQSICSATGCSFLFYAPIAALGTWFRMHRALAFGIVTAGSSLGGVVLPIMVEHLVASIGFGWAMRCTAFLFLGLLVVGNLTPASSRLPPLRKKFDMMEFINPFAERPFLLLTAAAFMIYLAAFLPFNFIITQAKTEGMSTGLADYMVPVMNAVSTFGRILPAHLGDRYGVFNVMILLTVLCGIVTLAIWLPAASNAPLIVYGALYGFASGCFLSIIPAMMASISDARKLGTRNGSLYAVASVGVLIGSPIGGAIVND